MEFSYKILLLSFVVTVLTSCSSLHADEVTEKPSVTDEQLSQALNDQRFLKFQIACALNKGPCDAIGIRLKKQVPRVMLGLCPECSSKDLKDIRKFIMHFQTKFPKEFKELTQKFVAG
ncbi:hypothetical protein HCN44_010542 [Aphidius gifuensis]|uniref:Chemosensory protein n=1 Tax=Aphidius gifuensis TaxID=684658 RepID=A0A834XVU1_APHGI|nr:allergen Tha p 1-like [Aphidius gifuensis]KAF7991741.1 hypothetical protein HCN44_010542 [Aphidius gifuensis]